MTKLNPEQVARAICVCLKANIPVAIWSEPGQGKSSIMAQIAHRLKWALYDVRLSDKEPSDFALPFPKDGQLGYLMSDLLPWSENGPTLLFLDEFDRALMAVQNMSLQLVLDRSVFGKGLPDGVRIVMAGNQASDIGTNQLSDAAATRMVHLYMETQSEGALDAWCEWAEQNEVSSSLVSFARFRKDVWAGQERNDLIEYAKPNKRTWVMADSLLRTMEGMKLKTADVERALVEGCVGSAAANELLGWRRLCNEAPTVEEIIADVDGCKVPTDCGVIYALALHLLNESKEDGTNAEAFVRYALRWGKEQASFFVQRLAKTVPAVVATKAYMRWEASRE